MAAESGTADRVKAWEDRWEKSQTGWHKADVHQMLSKHISSLNPDGKLTKVLVPLCGKTVDMKWLADQGITVVGVDGVQQALDEFYAEHGLERTETSISSLGPCGKLLQTNDGRIKLYCGDMMQITPSLEGKFDAVWDRGSLVALDRVDVPKYAQILKELLNPGGRVLVEVMEYDLDSMKDLAESRRPPPPHAMKMDVVKDLFEPECSVEVIDQGVMKFAENYEFKLNYYLIVKK